MSEYQTFGFGENDDDVGRSSDRFKMDKGEIARISFLWWPGLEEGKLVLDAKTPKFIGGSRNYLKGVGYFLNQGPEYTKIAGEPPKVRINTLIVKWPMKAGGKIDGEALAEGNFSCLYWVFDEGKYDDIKPIHNEWHFGSHDLKIKCTDAQFQKMSFSPCRDSLLQKLLEKGPDHPLMQKLLAAGQKKLPNIENEIGRRMTLDQIREKLAGGGGGGGGAAAVMDMAGTEEMDEAIDSLLDG